MKLLTDFLPILLFYVAYKLEGIYVATAVAMIASLAQVSYFGLVRRRVENVHWVTLGLIILFGGATLLFQDEAFIKWKSSVINWLFGVVFLGSQFVGKMPLIKRVMGQTLYLPDPVWNRLNTIWAAFFFIVGGLNWYVLQHFDTDTWADFKMFGTLGLTLVFLVGQGIYLMRYIDPSKQPENEE